MAEFILAYHGGKQPESKEAGAAQMARWRAWLEELGDAVINPGTPLGGSKWVTSNSVEDSPHSSKLSGFTQVRAGSLEEAIEMAKSCPFLEQGDMEVAEVHTMPQ